MYPVVIIVHLNRNDRGRCRHSTPTVRSGFLNDMVDRFLYTLLESWSEPIHRGCALFLHTTYAPTNVASAAVCPFPGLNLRKRIIILSRASFLERPSAAVPDVKQTRWIWFGVLPLLRTTEAVESPIAAPIASPVVAALAVTGGYPNGSKLCSGVQSRNPFVLTHPFLVILSRVLFLRYSGSIRRKAQLQILRKGSNPKGCCTNGAEFLCRILLQLQPLRVLQRMPEIWLCCRMSERMPLRAVDTRPCCLDECHPKSPSSLEPQAWTMNRCCSDPEALLVLVARRMALPWHPYAPLQDPSWRLFGMLS